MTAQVPRILVIGAHPDDADIKAGGTSAKWRALGYEVKLVSMTDGRAGHQSDFGPGLAKRRRAEAKAAGNVIGADYITLDIPDGELDNRLEYCHEIIRMIREFQPDLVITHRSTDYHRDHRFTGLLVQDAAYLVTVPAVCPETPHLMKNPVIMYFSDAFTKPCRFEPHVIVDIEAEYDKLIGMLHCHVSQFYEWLPYNAGYLDEVPKADQARRTWLADRIRQRLQPLANRNRDLLVQTYGADRGNAVQLVEAFEISEFGSPLDAAAWDRLFPFAKPRTPSKTFTNKNWVDIPGE